MEGILLFFLRKIHPQSQNLASGVIQVLELLK
jgi:hypothetical protein